MFLLSALSRRLGKMFSFVASWLRVVAVRARYPDVRVGRGVVLRQGCVIRATDGGRVEIGDHVVVGRGVEIVARRGVIDIGARVFIGNWSTITAIEHVKIGKHGLIAECVTIRDQNHGTERDGRPFSEQELIASAINISENVWVGAKATILAGVSIGSDSVVGANAVVTRSCGIGVTLLGVPAKPKAF